MLINNNVIFNCFRSTNGHHIWCCCFNSWTDTLISSVGSLYNFKGNLYIYTMVVPHSYKLL